MSAGYDILVTVTVKRAGSEDDADEIFTGSQSGWINPGVTSDSPEHADVEEEAVALAMNIADDARTFIEEDMKA